MISRKVAGILAALLLIVLLLAAVIALVQQRRIDAAVQQRDQARSQRDTAVTERDAARGATNIVTEYVDRVQVVREVGATIVKEVPVYVTPQADRACTIPVGFVGLHDAAAANQPVVGSAGDPDAPAPGLALSAVAGTVAGNYTACHATAQQLIGLQEFVRQRQALAQ